MQSRRLDSAGDCKPSVSFRSHFSLISWTQTNLLRYHDPTFSSGAIGSIYYLDHYKNRDSLIDRLTVTI